MLSKKIKINKVAIISASILIALAGILLITLTRAASPTDTANIWVNTVAGSNPQRCDTPCTYDPAKAYGSLSAAWAAANSGQIIRMAPGNYGPQTLSGSKESETKIIGSGPSSTVLQSLSINGDYATIQDTAINTGPSAHATGWGTGASHIKLDNVPVYGAFSTVWITGSDVKWLNSEFGSATSTPGQRDFCTGGDSEPLNISQGANNVTISNITFWPFDHVALAECGHLESIRIDSDGGAVHDITISNNFFKANNPAGSGHVFVTDSKNTVPYNLTFFNNIFTSTEGSFILQQNVATAACTNWVFAYNYMEQEVSKGNCNTASWSWVGNLGVKPAPACNGTYSKNVWQSQYNNSCGTDKWVSGANYSTDKLGFNTTSGLLASDSPGRDAGETSICSSLLGNVDFRGATRPFGNVCDAGPYEYGAGTSPIPKQGDLNNDGSVNIFDLSIILSNYGKTSAQANTPAADINNNGTVDGADLSILLSNYGS